VIPSVAELDLFANLLQISNKPFECLVVFFSQIGEVSCQFSCCVCTFWKQLCHEIHYLANCRRIRFWFHGFIASVLFQMLAGESQSHCFLHFSEFAFVSVYDFANHLVHGAFDHMLTS